MKLLIILCITPLLVFLVVGDVFKGDGDDGDADDDGDDTLLLLIDDGDNWLSSILSFDNNLSFVSSHSTTEWLYW